MKIAAREFTLSTDEKVRFEYDQESDLLEIIFRTADATCAVELTESIVLRFDWDTNEPLSLSFISLSELLQSTEYGEVHFQLLTNEWPENKRQKIWKMLKTSPLREFLKLSSYVPAHTHQIIPTATLKHTDALLQAA